VRTAVYLLVSHLAALGAVSTVFLPVVAALCFARARRFQFEGHDFAELRLARHGVQAVTLFLGNRNRQGFAKDNARLDRFELGKEEFGENLSLLVADDKFVRLAVRFGAKELNIDEGATQSGCGGVSTSLQV